MTDPTVNDRPGTPGDTPRPDRQPTGDAPPRRRARLRAPAGRGRSVGAGDRAGRVAGA